MYFNFTTCIYDFTCDTIIEQDNMYQLGAYALQASCGLGSGRIYAEYTT